MANDEDDEELTKILCVDLYYANVHRLSQIDRVKAWIDEKYIRNQTR